MSDMMMSRAILLLSIVCGLMTMPTAQAESVEAVRAALAKIDPKLQVDDLRPSDIAGLYRASLGGSNGYVTADGRYFIVGDLFDVASRRNLSETARKQERRTLLAQVKADDAIVFAPAKPSHTVTVFTDVECGYCRQLHGDIAKYNELGIAVRYVAYPRAGPGTEDWAKMEAVWCSADRRDALTRAKRGEKIEPRKECKATPVAEQYELGRKLGLTGTPMIVLEDGARVEGYVPPDRLARMLNGQSQKQPVAQAAGQ